MDAAHEEPTWTSLRAMGGDSIEALLSKKRRLLLISKAYTHRLTESSDVTRPSLAAARIGTPVPLPLPLFSTGETQPNEHASYASLDVHRSAYPELQKHVSITAPIQPEFLVHALALSSQQQQLQQHDQAASELAVQANAGPGRGVTPEQAVLLPPFASSMLGQLPDANPIRSPFANCSDTEALGAAAGRYDGIDMPTSVALPSIHLGQQQPQSQRLLLLDTLRRSTSATSADAVSVATLAAGTFSNATGDLHRRGSGSLFAFRRSSICSDAGAARRPSLGLSALIGGSSSACVVGEGGPGSGQPAPFNGDTANTADVSVGILTSRTADELTATHDDSRVGSDDDDENDVFAAVRFPTRLPRRGRVSCSGANTAPPGRTNPRFPAAAEFPDALWPSSVHAAQPNCITGPPGSSTDEHGKTSLGRLPMVSNIDDHDHEGDAYDIGRPAVWPAIEPQGTDQAVAASILKAAKDAAPSVLTRGCAQVSAEVGPEHNAAPSDSTRLPEHAELTAQADPDAHGPGGRPKGDAAAPGADAEVLRVPDSHGDWVGPVPGSAEYAVPATPLSVQVSDAALQAPGSITGGSLRVCKSHAGVSAVGGAPAPGNAGPGGNPASHGTTSPSCVHGMAEPLRQQPYGTAAAAEVTPKHGGLLRTPVAAGNGMGESVAPTPSACVSGVPSTPDSTPSADARRVMGGPVPRCGVAAAAPYVAHHGRSRQDGHDELMHPGRVLTVQVACGDCGAGGTDGPHLHDNMHHHTSSGHQHMYVACLVDRDAEADADRGVQRHAVEAAAKEPQVLQTSAVPGDDLGRLQQLGAPEDCGKAARRLTLYTWLLPHVGPPHLHSTLHLLARAPAAAGDAHPAAPSPSGRPPHDGCRRAGASCAPNPVDATVCAAALRRAHAFRLLVAPDDCLLLLLSSALDGSEGLRRPPEDPGGGLLERRYSGLEDAHRGGDTDIPDGGVSIMIFRHGVWTQQRVLSTPLDSCGSVRFYSLACTQEQLYSISVEPIGGAALAAKVEGGLGGSGTCSTPPEGSLHDPHHRQQKQQRPSRRGPWWWQVVAAGAGGYGCVWRLAPCTEAVLQVATLPQATCMARPLQGVMELQVLPHKPQWVLGMSCPESCVVLWDVGRVREVAGDGEGKAVAGEALGSAAVTWSPAVLLCVVQPDDGVVLWGLQPVGAAAHAGSRRGGMGAATGVVCSGIDEEVSGREVEGCGMAGQHVAFLARCSARMMAEGGASYGYGRPDVTEGPSSVVVVLLEEGQLKLGEGLPVAQVASLGLNGRLGVVGTQQGQVLAWDCKHGALTAGWQMPEAVTSVDVSERVLLAAAGSEVLVAQV